MTNSLGCIILIFTILVVIGVLVRYLMKSEERFSVINSKKITDENIAMPLFETGDNRIFPYEFSLEVLYGRQPGGNMVGPPFGFLASELKKRNMTKAIKKKGDVEYVDNALMVPYIVSALQLLKKQMDIMQDNLNTIADKNFK
jgi:hypothetical protein